MILQNILDVMNIELTTNCPLRCPQCYCTLEGGENIELSTAIKYVTQGKQLGLKEVMLSGGETLCYPYLSELIREIKSININVNIAISGFGFDENIFEKLISDGVDKIVVSLNGSTNEINQITRDGYELSVSALSILNKKKFKNCVVNWVMHSSNAYDFENMISLCEKYNVSQIVVMAVKPNSKNELLTIPTKEQMLYVADIIKNYTGKMKVAVETCFFPMLAMIRDTKLFGNFNKGKYIGCGAGRWGVSVSVNGMLSPCRHLDYYEKFDSIEEYWNKSEIIKKIKSATNTKREPCSQCKYNENCRHCLAINAKINNGIYIGNEYCPIYEGKQ